MEIREVSDFKSETVESKERGGDEPIKDDSPTTSNASDVKPEHVPHNINLKALDFNSADDIRQAMKAIISESEATPQNCQDVADNKTLSIDKKSTLTSPPTQTADIIRIDVDGNKHRDLPNAAPISRKRPGRPSKAGPSKKARRVNLNDMYLGKLSNVVPFKNSRKRKYTCDSETDTVFIYY